MACYVEIKAPDTIHDISVGTIYSPYIIFEKLWHNIGEVEGLIHFLLVLYMIGSSSHVASRPTTTQIIRVGSLIFS